MSQIGVASLVIYPHPGGGRSNTCVGLGVYALSSRHALGVSSRVRVGRVPMASMWSVSDTATCWPDVRPKDAVYTPVTREGTGPPRRLRPGRADI
mgnify:CR=1 FL=1